MIVLITQKFAAVTGHLLFRRAAILAVVLSFGTIAIAGGPEYVAGSSFFNSSVIGQPLSWSKGEVNYYTDQGDLSPILPNTAANAFVASAFLQWSSVSVAAITLTNPGQLAEDVNGSNIAVNSNGAVTAPADITPAATQIPIGIVYDYDGTVTDALLGAGAGGTSQCFWNAVYGGTDNFNTSANFLHALVVINGQCALQPAQLTDVEYRLVRVLGNVLGLGWSQLNLNVSTGNPHPTADDYAGFPVMHYMDSINCVPITVCYPNPYQLAPDDVAALSRLYPPATSPPNAARIHGSVYFLNHFGAEDQPMQGVNVFARWIDPSTGLPSHQYSVSSVSGFLFTGNTGNPITGLIDSLGNAYSEFGSADQTLEGFFDLGGLPIPNGESTAQYQLSVEPLDPLWSSGVCPYDFSQVAPSGSFAPMVITVSAGGDFEQDIPMSGSALEVPPWSASETWAAPAIVPGPGDWVGSLSGYGDVSYFQITAQANRTLSVAVTALDESGSPTESKAAPVVGMWNSGDAGGTVPPVLTSVPFNSSTFGMSRLDAQVLNASSFIIGISDLRGDGRPDYAYHAHVLYGDSVNPARIPIGGEAITLQGIGFAPGLTVSMGSHVVPLLATDASQILVAAPAQSDGPQTITITDPASGSISTMTNALRVRVVASDGVTAVNGATVAWSTTNGATLSVCGGASSCSVVTDESGLASTAITPAAIGVATFTATLAPAAYNPAQSVSGTLSATSTASDIGITTPYLWIAQGATLSVPVTARVVSTGTPQAGVTVDFRIAQGSGSLSAASAVTNSTGYASVMLTLTNFAANVQVVACVASGSPCQTAYGNAVAATALNLQAVAGAGQVITAPPFQPLTVRVTDSSTPSNPVLGAAVLFQSTVLRPPANDLTLTSGDTTGTQTGMPIILMASQSGATSDANGLANFLPSLGSFTGLLEVEIQISAGTNAALEDVMESFP